MPPEITPVERKKEMNELTLSNASGVQVLTFSETLFSKFYDYTDVKETTLKGYAVCIRQFMNWMQLNGIRQPQREDIKAYKAHLERENYTAGTKAQYLRAVKHFFKWTASEGLYPNIADNIKGAKVRQDNTKKEAFSEADMQTILNSIERKTEAGKRDFCMILLSVTGGLRIIEMQRADIADLQTIKGQKVLYIQGKGHDEKDDYIKIIPDLSEALEDYFKSRGEVKKTEPLFVGTGNRSRGERLSEPSISRIIKNRFKNAGYDCGKLTAHSLRHTSNTLLFKAGADLYTVQQHARHADPKTTEIYLHANSKEADRSEEKIYMQIFNPQQKDTATKAYEALQNLPEDLQKEALNYILSLQVQQCQLAI